jgi:hypothetical protein
LYQNLLSDSSLYALLPRLDEDLAAEAKERGCPCSGRLHRARYPRKPRGIPTEVEDAYSHRSSFCCANDGCRRRTTPRSFRFLERKVFVSAVVVLVSALRHGPTAMRVAKLRDLVGVSARTVYRWHCWWQGTFRRSPFWKAARRLLRSPVDERSLPLSLLEAFPGADPKMSLLDLLHFILPLTTSWSVQAFCGSVPIRRRCRSKLTGRI